MPDHRCGPFAPGDNGQRQEEEAEEELAEVDSVGRCLRCDVLGGLDQPQGQSCDHEDGDEPAETEDRGLPPAPVTEQEDDPGDHRQRTERKAGRQRQGITDRCPHRSSVCRNQGQKGQIAGTRRVATSTNSTRLGSPSFQ